MKKVILAVAATVVLLAGTSSAVQASDSYYNKRECCYYKKVVTYKTVIDYEIRTEKYVKYVTCYDYCGKPYTVTKCCYRDIKVPVKRCVPCVSWVKCCY